MDHLFLPFIAFTALCLILFLWIIFLKRQNIKLASQLQGVNHTLTETRKQLDSLNNQLQNMSDFQQSMAKAQLTTRLQTPRVLQKGNESTTPPEKYQYILSLTERGMGADEISSVLSISRHEAQQLVSLALLSRKSSQQKVKKEL